MNNLNSKFPRNIFYRIADLQVQIVDLIGINEKLAMPSFIPFQSQSDHEIDSLITIEISTEPLLIEDIEWKLLSDVSVIWDERFRFEEGKNHYLTSILGSNDANTWKMLSTKDFSYSKIYFDSTELYSTTKLSWLIMVAFGQACLFANTMLIHSSVIEYAGKAYAFLGKSGTGKSTHSRLWIAHLSGSELLNDDNPAIQVLPSGEVNIFGTPWSGKTHCYKNKKIELAGITRLSQALQNNFIRKKGLDALIALLPSGSAIRWNNTIFSQMVNIIESLIVHIPIGHLECLPDKDAVDLHFAEIKKG